MVQITKEYLIKNSENLKLLSVRQKKESDVQYLNRITHLKLQGRFIDSLGNLKECRNVTHLYLQNNLLQEIRNVAFSKLTHLYLQRNKIKKLENLDTVVNLKKLYVGYNEIAVVEGLESLRTLKELHLEFQSLPLGETIYFDPRSVSSLSGCLEILNVTGNGMISLWSLSGMDHLVELLAMENKLHDLQDLGNVLPSWPNLTRINLAGNPLTALRDFKDTAILKGRYLKHLDETEISSTTRKFLEGWKNARRTEEESERNADGDKPFAGYPKAVHFTQLPGAKNELARSTPQAPLTFQPWKIRENMHCFGDRTTRPFRFRSSRRRPTNTQAELNST